METCRWARGHTCAQHTHILPMMHVLPGTPTLRPRLCVHFAHVHLPTHRHGPPGPPALAGLSLPPLSCRWRAGNHSAFWGMTLDEGIRYRLGTIRPSSSVASMNEIHVSPVLPTTLPSHGLGSRGSWHLAPYSSEGHSPLQQCARLHRSLSFSGPSALACSERCRTGKRTECCASSPSPFLASPDWKKCCWSQLGQDPGGQEVTLVFWEGKNTHFPSSGQRAAILGNSSEEPQGKRGLLPSH